MELRNIAQFGFLAPGTNPPCVPKRILEATFISPQEDDHDRDRETIFINIFVTLEYN